jgi:hypothetical protein
MEWVPEVALAKIVELTTPQFLDLGWILGRMVHENNMPV